ncbi:MAG: cobalamin biosynthesis protein, partial [Thermocrispum sp.]
MPSPRWPTATGLAAGYLADRVLGDPKRAHPVALFGGLAARLEARAWADSRARGALYATVCVGASAATGALVESRVGRAPLGRVSRTRDHESHRSRFERHALGRAAAVALATWTVLGGRGLAAEGEAMAGLLAAGDLPAARGRLGHLCGRDARGLDEKELARAATESIAENTSDAVVAP